MSKLINRYPLCALLIAAGVAAATPDCGDVIVLNAAVPYNLTGNVGPCPIDGLKLNGQGTINLNGFSILGVSNSSGSAGAGLYLLNAYPVVINGPGTISNFLAGVQITPYSAGIVVQNLTLANNQTGISANQASDVHLRGNTITGRGNAVTGIFITSSGPVKIKENVITGQTFTGVTVNHSFDVTVTLNTIESNLDGLVAEPFGELGVLLLGNSVTKNYRDGMRINGSGGPPYVAVAEGNDASYNVRDGLALFGGPSTAYRAEDNRVYMNSRHGINVTAGWRVLENWISRSGSRDIFSTGAPGTCFSFNQYKTSTPVSLPVCAP